ncbi:MAG TPA: hypothetical protein VIL20_24330 [Sandaracinaceae bacterium]
MLRRAPARAQRRVLAAVCGLVVAVASTALPTYLWCASSGEVHLTCCCPEVESDASFVRAPCCEERTTLSPEGAQARDAASRIAPAAPAPVVSRVGAPVLARDVRVEDRAAVARDGPRHRPHARNSVYLL